MAEQKLPKLKTRVRFPSPAPSRAKARNCPGPGGLEALAWFFNRLEFSDPNGICHRGMNFTSL